MSLERLNRRAGRAGFSLMEVLLATSILLGCVIVLSKLAGIGREHAQAADKYALAQQLCHTKMEELLAGALPAQALEDQPLEDHPGWSFSVAIEPLEVPGLASATVTVVEDPQQDLSEGPDKVQPVGRSKSFTLVRWIRDPYSTGGRSFQTPVGLGDRESSGFIRP